MRKGRNILMIIALIAIFIFGVISVKHYRQIEIERRFAEKLDHLTHCLTCLKEIAISFYYNEVGENYGDLNTFETIKIMIA